MKFPFAQIDPEEEDQSVPLWLITFTDIMALMLTFFVLLYSMSIPEIDKWDAMSQAVNKGLGKVYTMDRLAGSSTEISIEKISTKRALDLSYLANIIDKNILSTEGMENAILLQSAENLILSLPADLVFESGGSEVSIQGKRAIFQLGAILNKIRNRIEVIGHADPRPVRGNRYASNWELSLARATSIAGLLSETGYERAITIRGLSSARYDEIEGDGAVEFKQNAARRVDIIIMKDTGKRREFFKLDGSG